MLTYQKCKEKDKGTSLVMSAFQTIQSGSSTIISTESLDKNQPQLKVKFEMKENLLREF